MVQLTHRVTRAVEIRNGGSGLELLWSFVGSMMDSVDAPPGMSPVPFSNHSWVEPGTVGPPRVSHPEARPTTPQTAHVGPPSNHLSSGPAGRERTKVSGSCQPGPERSLNRHRAEPWKFRPTIVKSEGIRNPHSRPVAFGVGVESAARSPSHSPRNVLGQRSGWFNLRSITELEPRDGCLNSTASPTSL